MIIIHSSKERTFPLDGRGFMGSIGVPYHIEIKGDLVHFANIDGTFDLFDSITIEEIVAWIDSGDWMIYKIRDNS